MDFENLISSKLRLAKTLCSSPLFSFVIKPFGHEKQAAFKHICTMHAYMQASKNNKLWTKWHNALVYVAHMEVLYNVPYLSSNWRGAVEHRNEVGGTRYHTFWLWHVEQEPLHLSSDDGSTCGPTGAASSPGICTRYAIARYILIARLTQFRHFQEPKQLIHEKCII